MKIILNSHMACPRQAWMKTHGIEAEEKLQSPREKRNESIILDEEEICKVEQTLLEYKAIISQEKLTQPREICSCSKCCYA